MPEPVAPPKPNGKGKIMGLSTPVALLAVGIGVLLVFLILSRPKTSNAAQAGDSSSTPAPDLTGVGDALTQLNTTVSGLVAQEQSFQDELLANFTMASGASGAATSGSGACDKKAIHGKLGCVACPPCSGGESGLPCCDAATLAQHKATKQAA